MFCNAQRHGCADVGLDAAAGVGVVKLSSASLQRALAARGTSFTCCLKRSVARAPLHTWPALPMSGAAAAAAVVEMFGKILLENNGGMQKDIKPSAMSPTAIQARLL